MASGKDLYKATDHKDMAAFPVCLRVKDLFKAIYTGFDDHTLHKSGALDDLGKTIIPAHVCTLEMNLHPSSRGTPLATTRAMVSQFVTQRDVFEQALPSCSNGALKNIRTGKNRSAELGPNKPLPSGVSRL